MELLLFYIYQFRPEIRVAEIIMDHFFYQFVLAYQEFFKSLQASFPVRFIFISCMEYDKRRVAVSLYHMSVYYLLPVTQRFFLI